MPFVPVDARPNLIFGLACCLALLITAYQRRPDWFLVAVAVAPWAVCFLPSGRSPGVGGRRGVDDPRSRLVSGVGGPARCPYWRCRREVSGSLSVFC